MYLTSLFHQSETKYFCVFKIKWRRQDNSMISKVELNANIDAMEVLNINGLELTSINKDVITYFEQRPMLVDVSAEAKGECNINFKLTGTFHANDLTVNALCFT